MHELVSYPAVLQTIHVIPSRPGEAEVETVDEAGHCLSLTEQRPRVVIQPEAMIDIGGGNPKLDNLAGGQQAQLIITGSTCAWSGNNVKLP